VTVSARILTFTSPVANSAGRLDARWTKPGDAVVFQLSAWVEGDPREVRAEVWTNAGNNHAPGHYAAFPMDLARAEGHRATWQVAVPNPRVGNYRAVGRVSVDGGTTYQWMSERGIPDVTFRPRDASFEALDIEVVSVPNVNRSADGGCGTLADMMEEGSPLEGGPYTLRHLRDQGKDCVWLLPPFENSRVVRLHPADDATSPYAIQDFFSIRAEIARSARGLAGEEARAAALQEFRDFVALAHRLGVKVVLDLPLNHLGHRHLFRDLFVRRAADGTEVREVRAHDFSNMEFTPEQMDLLRRRLLDPGFPRHLEHLAPWMYASRRADPAGARGVDDIAPGGWFEWPDALQLNHGRRRVAYREFRDFETTPVHRAVRGWLGRVLRFWAVDMGVDGFRVDHLAGTHPSVMEVELNLLQADVDHHRPGSTALLVGEDHDTAHVTQHWVDYLQGGFADDLVRARTAADLEKVLESPYFRHVLCGAVHDDPRVMAKLGGDARAAARFLALMQLLGGPVCEVAGDRLGEPHPLPFKQYRRLGCLEEVSAGGRAMTTWMERVGQVRSGHLAFHGTDRCWLRPWVGGPDGDLAVFSRLPPPDDDGAMVVAANMSNDRERENAFRIDGVTAGWIQPDGAYVARDLLAEDGAAKLWDKPLTGKHLKNQGLFVKLKPYQVQVIRVHRA
jgi:hypothetical protein